MSASTTVRPAPRPPLLGRDEALRLAASEYGRFAAQLRRLDPGDWERPTECTAWDVRQMAAHVLGMAEMVAFLRQTVRQNVLSARAGGGIDALTGLQVRERDHLSPEEIQARFEAALPRAVRGRRRLSRVIGRLTLPEEQVVGVHTERWRFGFLFDVVLTRDTWMHRVDIARATGREPELTPAHDGVLVADVVREWAERHGRPYRLRLTGPAGGTWSAGQDGEDVEMDAVEFCRVLSGRGSGAGLLTQQVPF
ncbi:maleylpyruvate isomerase family mycothiol-dependent enzyme [Geodermatophilus sp. SYSU D00691]